MSIVSDIAVIQVQRFAKKPKIVDINCEARGSKLLPFPCQIRQKCFEMDALCHLIARHRVQNCSLIPAKSDKNALK
jgi:hypothetical protein